ncbi:MAG: DinB family protein [Caldilineaceae bacterium]|nr:DinB family protein [Caldilineaceae bacterium]
MISGDSLAANFERNASYVRGYLEGLTQADSLVQPPVKGNCINWILGHIVCYRTYVQAICELPPVLDEAAAKRYARDSAPVTGPAADLTPIETLRAAYNASQQALLGYLQTLSPTQAAEVVTAAGFTLPRAELLTTFMRHESFHTGQFELLRELALAAKQ